MRRAGLKSLKVSSATKAIDKGLATKIADKVEDKVKDEGKHRRLKVLAHTVLISNGRLGKRRLTLLPVVQTVNAMLAAGSGPATAGGE